MSELNAFTGEYTDWIDGLFVDPSESGIYRVRDISQVPPAVGFAYYDGTWSLMAPTVEAAVTAATTCSFRTYDWLPFRKVHQT